jgi:hypothetical protein
MATKVQRLTFVRPYPAVARHGRIGRTWETIAKPRSTRRAVMERLAQHARVDNPDALIRIR